MLRVSDKLIKNEDSEDDFCEHNEAREYKGIFYGDNSEKNITKLVHILVIKIYTNV